MQDPIKVKTILDELNDLPGKGKGQWVEAEGYHAMFAAKVTGNHSLDTEASKAVAFKVFVNLATGESRFYVLQKIDPEYGNDEIKLAPSK